VKGIGTLPLSLPVGWKFWDWHRFRIKRFVCSPKRPDRLGGQPSLLFIWHPVLYWG